MKYVLIALIGLLIGCKTSENLKPLSLAPNTETWLVTPSFEIQCTVARPLVSSGLSQVANLNLLGAGNSVNRIDLGGRGDFLRITDTKVKATISYYGVQRTTNANPNENGIILDGTIENYTAKYNEKKNTKHISFDTRHQLESYTIDITIYPGGSCFIEVTSSRRDSINYDGIIKEFTPAE